MNYEHKATTPEYPYMVTVQKDSMNVGQVICVILMCNGVKEAFHGIEILIYPLNHMTETVKQCLARQNTRSLLKSVSYNKLILQYQKTRCCKYYTLYNYHLKCNDTVLQF